NLNLSCACIFQQKESISASHNFRAAIRISLIACSSVIEQWYCAGLLLEARLNQLTTWGVSFTFSQNFTVPFRGRLRFSSIAAITRLSALPFTSWNLSL